MSFDANAPGVVTSLRSQLQACPSWVAASGQLSSIHYPNADWATENTMPAAEILHKAGNGQRAYLGVTVLRGGTFELTLFHDSTLGSVEKLSRDISSEICTTLGIVGLQVDDITEAELAEDAEVTAQSENIKQVVMTLTYGLEP